MSAVNISAPTMRPDGSCPACIGGWKCAHHIAEDSERDARMSGVLRRTVAGMQQARIYHVCARFELETDQFLTREQKASAMLCENPNLA